MKKILSFITIVAVAVAAQAATISWNSGSVYLNDGTKMGATGAPAVTAYYILASDISSFSASSYLEANFNHTTGAFTGTADKTVNGTAFGANWGSQGSYSAGDSQSMIAVFTYKSGDDYYAIARAVTGKIGGDGKNISVQNISGVTTQAAGTGAWTKVATVPEPCTVALLALGLAAVGLKRKIA